MVLGYHLKSPIIHFNTNLIKKMKSENEYLGYVCLLIREAIGMDRICTYVYLLPAVECMVQLLHVHICVFTMEIVPELFPIVEKGGIE